MLKIALGHCDFVRIVHTHRSDGILRRALFTALQTGRFEGNYRWLVTHIAETVRQRAVLRTQVGQAERLQSSFAELHLVERSFGFGAIVFAQTGELLFSECIRLSLLVVLNSRHHSFALFHAILDVRHRQRFLQWRFAFEQQHVESLVRRVFPL